MLLKLFSTIWVRESVRSSFNGAYILVEEKGLMMSSVHVLSQSLAFSSTGPNI